MSNRLNQERESELQPKRIAAAKTAIEALGFDICFETETELRFYFKGAMIKYYPYSGWATGMTIKDGRGLQNLLKQLK